MTMPTILTYGDSNTYGTPPMMERGGPHERFGPTVRWPGVMATSLGQDWTVIEDGLPGRTTRFSDPVMGAHMNGEIGLRIALCSQGPIDLLTIMLGTNDSKLMFGQDARGITAGIAGLLAIATEAEMQDRHGGFKILIICPPTVIVTGCIADVFYQGDEVSEQLAAQYSGLAAHWGVGFMNAGDHIAVSDVDGVHFDESQHDILGRAVAAKVRTMAPF
jgi:lysophospholipase L1-like esterase